VLKVQNRGTADVVIPDLDTLNAAIQLIANPLAGPITCPPVRITPQLTSSQTFPLAVRSKRRLRIRYELTYTCGPNPSRDAFDYEFSALVDHLAIDANPDDNQADDVCPREPLGTVPNPDGSIHDKGCGKRGPDGGKVAPAVNVKDDRSFNGLLVGGAFDVGTTTFTFVDPNRETMPNGDFPGAPDRTLPTLVWYPADRGQGGAEADLAQGGAPYPFVIFSHGLGSPPNASVFLTTHLASHGYIVVAPAYPLSTLGAPGGQTMADAPAEAGDVSFLIDIFLGFNTASGNRFEGGIDPDRIALTGHSAGGLTTTVATYDSNVRDPRIKAAVPMAGPACWFLPGYFTTVDVPLLILHGDNDLLVDYLGHAEPYFANANAPKSLVRVLGGNHLGFSDAGVAIDDAFGCAFLPDPDTLAAQTENLITALGGAANNVGADFCPTEFCDGDPTAIPGMRQQQIAKQAILAFFEWHLRGDDAARDYLLNDLEPLNADLSHQHTP
jgi:acetyl esterase/lipase